MAGLDTELEAALIATEASFHVRLIATFAPDVIWAPADVEATRWLAENHPEFDQFPVKDDAGTVGILLREPSHPGKTVREAMRPLRDGLIVSAEMPLGELIPQLSENHYRLVLRRSQIDGLVTQSDLLKLPVRMLLFGLVSHLELCFRELVRARVPWPKWLELLDAERRRAVQKKLIELKDARFEPDPLEFTNLSDVLDVLGHQPDLSDGVRAEAEGIRNLRNDIAHAKTYIASPHDVRVFVERFNSIRDWIDCASQILKTAK